jgi:phosphoglycolate phosphatase-like HAD superfamily hydrolase
VDRLVLFDIDCTLLDAHGAGGRAILRAIKDVYGVEGELGGYTFHGRTDPGIISDLAGLWGAGLQAAGEPDAAASPFQDGRTQTQIVHDVAEDLGVPGDTVDERLAACLDRYVRILAEEIRRGRVEVLPGVQELVGALADEERALVGLVTGNIEAGARLKLQPTGLLPHFAVGAYGSDSALRGDLPPLAVARAERLTGRRFRGKQIVVVGDTPADIGCGEPLGVKTVAVATGKHTPEELAAHAPDHLFADFGDWGDALEAILA